MTGAIRAGPIPLPTLSHCPSHTHSTPKNYSRDQNKASANRSCRITGCYRLTQENNHTCSQRESELQTHTDFSRRMRTSLPQNEAHLALRCSFPHKAEQLSDPGSTMTWHTQEIPPPFPHAPSAKAGATGKAAHRHED